MAFRGAIGVKNTSSGSAGESKGVTAGDDGVFVCKSEAFDFPTALALGGVIFFFEREGGGLFLGSWQLSASTILRDVQTAPLPPRQPRGLREKAPWFSGRRAREAAGRRVAGVRPQSEGGVETETCSRDSLQFFFFFSYFFGSFEA